MFNGDSKDGEISSYHQWQCTRAVFTKESGYEIQGLSQQIVNH